MKYKFYIYLFVLTSISAYAQDIIKPVEKKDRAITNISYEAAFIKAKAEEKNVLLYFTAPWCGPCKWMEKNVFPLVEVNKLITENYIGVKINSDTQKGSKLYKQYNDSGIPLFVIVTPDNKLLKQKLGRATKDEFTAFLKPDSRLIAKPLAEPAPETIKIDLGIGLRLGAVNNSFSDLSLNNRTGFTTDLFYSAEINNLYILRAGIGFNSKGSQNFSINYLRFPLEFGIKILNGSLINTQGGIRAIVAPYYALRLNKTNNGLSSNDYGARFGLSHYIGSFNQLELEFYYEHGMQDIFKNINGKQTNRSFGVSILLSL
ncbi:thioredoxin family protein [Winogradskyella sp.]|nr:thioredoxin family protein [Winogradskyella sp.]